MEHEHQPDPSRVDPQDPRLVELERQIGDLRARLAIVEEFLATRFL